MPSSKGELEDAIRALRVQLEKGLGIAPFPGWDDTSPEVVLANAKALALSAAVLASDLPNSGRPVADAATVSDTATPLFRTVRLKVALSETVSVADSRSPVLV